MLGIHDYGLFVATGVLLNLTPGQDTFYILGRSIAQGRRIGVASALGISAGGVVHTLAAALGLSAVLATSASAFIALKVVGPCISCTLAFACWSRARPGRPGANTKRKRQPLLWWRSSAPPEENPANVPALRASPGESRTAASSCRDAAGSCRCRPNWRSRRPRLRSSPSPGRPCT
jgi:hypothetical protein